MKNTGSQKREEGASNPSQSNTSLLLHLPALTRLRHISTSKITLFSIFLIMVSLAIFFETVTSIVKGWLTREHSHGFLIFALSMYMIWTKRNALRSSPIQPNILVGTLLTILGCSIYVVGRFGSILLMQQVSLIITAIGIVWLLLGSARGRILLLPLCYLVLMFPILNEILGNAGLHFQLIATVIASSLLKITNMSIFQQGQFIELPHITLEVSKLCSGISHITALVSLAVPLAYVTQRTTIRKILLIFIAFLMGIFANGLRVALIGIWTRYFSDSTIHGPFSMLYSSSVFMLEFFILILFALLIGKTYIKEGVTQAKIKPQDKCVKTFPKRYSAAVMIAALIVLTTASYEYFSKPVPVYLNKNTKEIPLVVGTWRGRDVDKLGESFEMSSPDFELKRVYYDGSGNRMKLYIGYFASQNQDHEVINYRYDWLHNNAAVFKVPTDSSEMFIKKTRYNDQDQSKLAYFWYDIDGKVMIDRYKAKLTTVINAITKRRTNAAIIIVSGQKHEKTGFKNSGNTTSDFVELLFPAIRNYLISRRSNNG